MQEKIEVAAVFAVMCYAFWCGWSDTRTDREERAKLPKSERLWDQVRLLLAGLALAGVMFAVFGVGKYVWKAVGRDGNVSSAVERLIAYPILLAAAILVWRVFNRHHARKQPNLSAPDNEEPPTEN